MPLISEADIERVNRSTDLVALVRSRGVELRRHGSKDFIGRCPFHPDQDPPHFIVAPHNGLFHCPACGVAGNPIQFIERHDGVSFRHAFELLAGKDRAAFGAQLFARRSTVPRLPCPLDPQEDDAALLGRVAAYYHERLKQSASARAYLASRGLDGEELIDRFQLGLADRTLGLRLPMKNRQDGKALRSRLMQLGLWRESGHEHFNGCIIVPLFDEAGCEPRAAQATDGPRVVSFYGRRMSRGALKHLYPPGPHRGLLNTEGLRNAEEVILCEAVFDALTFCAHGFANVTCLYGTEGFTDELWEALKNVRRVTLAYDADDAGERAAQRDAERFHSHGIEVFRIKFPHGMDANEYARKGKLPDKSLALLLNSAQWLGKAKPSPTAASPRHAVALTSSLAAEFAADSVPAAKEEKQSPAVDAASIRVKPCSSVVTSSVETTSLEQRGDAWFLDIEGREYRVAGLERTLGTDALKIALRLRVGVPSGSDRFHLDHVDLCRDTERLRFIERAAEETGLTADLLKRDVARLLLAVEQAQAELVKPREQTPPVVTLTPGERETALKWLREPNLIGRLREAFHLAGIIGEESNTLAAYLAGVSRKLERPLAIIIQSASAAGKTTLMDAVLSFFPEEERVKYSAMTGQSLYYLGETSLQNKILAVVEETGAERASYALKLLQSEGELTIASTGKDPQTGRLITQEYHVEGPVMIFLTTTAIDLDEELQNRCLTLTVDETPEQTGRIHRVQRERRTLAGLLAHEQRKDLLRKLRNAQRLLSPLAVVNPFAPALTFATARTRNRRDHEKYLTLIDAIALLHQHQREIKTLPEGPLGAGTACFIEATLDDIALANELAPEVLGRSLDELPPQTRRLLGFIRELMKQKRTSNATSAKVGAGSACFSRRELRDHCGWSLTQVRVHLERLVELEHLAVRHGRLGSQFVYEVLFDIEAPEAVAHVGLLDVAKLKGGGTATHGYTANLAGFAPGVAGRNGHLTGDGGIPPPPVAVNADNALVNT